MRWGWNQWCFLLSRPQPLTLASLGLGSKQYSAAIAFTLALFSHLVNHVNIRLQAELEEGENPVPAFQSDGAGAGMGEAVAVDLPPAPPSSGSGNTNCHCAEPGSPWKEIIRALVVNSTV